MRSPETAAESVLVLDADTLPALAVVRSLGRIGLNVLVASHHPTPVCGYSRYAGSCLRYPNPMRETAAFLDWMQDTVDASPGLAMIVPVTERTVVPLSQRFAHSGASHLFAMADPEALECVLDKSRTAALASSCEVPQPRSWNIHAIDELEPLEAELEFPVVVKPARSISDGELRTSLTVRYAHDLPALKRLVGDLLPQTDAILQEFFRGDGIGVEVLANRGDIVYAFQHRRLHEVPLSGGGSSLRISEEVDPELLGASKRLMAALHWHGVAMVEFKKNPDSNRYILVEINGRFWGSLPLATAAGADFPRLLWAQHKGEALPALPPYRRGLKCRKLAGDLAWCEAVWRQSADPRLVTLPPRSDALRGLLAMLSPVDSFDAQSWSDPRPGLVDLWRTCRLHLNRVTDAAVEGARALRIRFQSRRSVVASRAGTARKLLFVCYGNINRSAVAEAIARGSHASDESGRSFRSAGFHPVAGREPDPRMQQLARARDIDMSGIRSTVLDAELVRWADLVLVMEATQVETVRSAYPGAPVFLLGGLLPDRLIASEIQDPYRKPQAVYERVLEMVSASVNELTALAAPGTDRR